MVSFSSVNGGRSDSRVAASEKKKKRRSLGIKHLVSILPTLLARLLRVLS